MATIEFWIQLENNKWDMCSSGKDRLTGMDVADLPGGQPPVNITLRSPVTGVTRTVQAFQPVRDSEGDVEDALILRRYTPNWAAPDDRKVNPWDINELNPTDTGTMGTIPGPVIECSVGDSVIVHFRNRDMRTRPLVKVAQAVTAKGMSAQMFAAGTIPTGGMGGMAGMGASTSQPRAQLRPEIMEALRAVPGLLEKFPFPFRVSLPVLQRTHSLHTHGFVFAPTSDGAYPLTPPDPTQPVGAEAALWANVSVTGAFKQGDRVPPGGTFIYSWNTIGWPTTQGVWLYHDHSVCDTENVSLGAIGIVVIHPPQNDPMGEQDVDIRLPNGAPDPNFLPGGSVNGNPISSRCFPLQREAQATLLPHQFERIAPLAMGSGMASMMMEEPTHDTEMTPGRGATKSSTRSAAAKKSEARHKPEPGPKPPAATEARMLHLGNVAFQLDDKLTTIVGFCFSRFRTPPTKATYLQLYHEFANAGMCINGRKYLGNTPTVLGGPTTKMKFGVVGMGSMTHTFHIHGHRWLIPGPGAKGTAGLQFGSSVDTPVSQFEDTRLFGPANSFSFTIDEGNGFMRASPPLGEWHMHCHVLAHMMDGMMGSLLIVNGGEPAPPLSPLQEGQACPTMIMDTPEPTEPQPNTTTVQIVNFQFNPDPVTISAGDTVRWVWASLDHSTTSNTGLWDSGVHNQPFTFDRTFNSPGTFGYHCTQHGSPGSGMRGTITVTP